MKPFTRRSVLRRGAISALAPVCPWAWALAAVEEEPPYPLWLRFKRQFVQADGRVVSDDGGRSSTYSEGQAYALLFALVANDREGFERVLDWTINNLCQGDMAVHLPAWLWGRRASGQWGVLDANAASDADVWIVYALQQAGRLWHSTDLVRQAKALSDLVLSKECVQIPGLGWTLLPGPVGFHTPDRWKLNPSYAPLQVLQSLQALAAPWRDIARSSFKLIQGASPRGICADWIWYDQSGRFSQDLAGEADGRSGYNAIRVYLWAGMLHPQAPYYDDLHQILAPMAAWLDTNGVPAEYLDPWTLQAQGQGPAGFSAALIPFLAAQGRHRAMVQQQDRLRAQPIRSTAYYEQCLGFFALSWQAQCLAFDPKGQLLVRWAR